MPDILTPDQRHECMSHIRSRNTKPEVKLRKELSRLGYRYRLNVKGLDGSPDIVLAKYRTCIFVKDASGTATKVVRYLFCIKQTLSSGWQRLRTTVNGT